jgi:hypothetical protein
MDNDILLMNILQHKFGLVSNITISGGKIIECPGGIPSQADQDTWTTEYEAYVAANEYKGLRKTEYDKLNQYEMQFDDQRDGTTTWVDAINAIKAAHPKP